MEARRIENTTAVVVLFEGMKVPTTWHAARASFAARSTDATRKSATSVEDWDTGLTCVPTRETWCRSCSKRSPEEITGAIRSARCAVARTPRRPRSAETNFKFHILSEDDGGSGADAPSSCSWGPTSTRRAAGAARLNQLCGSVAPSEAALARQRCESAAQPGTALDPEGARCPA